MANTLPAALHRMLEAEDAEGQVIPAPTPTTPKDKTPEPPPNPILVLARKTLRRWDLEIACSGTHSWIETTGTRKKIWLILQNGDEVTFELVD